MLKKIGLGLSILLLLILGFIFIFSPNLVLNTSVIYPNQSTSLPIPVLLDDINPIDGQAEFNLSVQTGEMAFIEGKITPTLGYNGNYLGPVIKVSRNDQVVINVNNRLNESTSVHWHGLEVDGLSDGGPLQVIDSNSKWTASFIVDQDAATLWFHPHVMGSTATQVYQGLAGLLIVEDEKSKLLNLPNTYGVNDIPLILQDRSFNEDGTFVYINSMDGAYGNKMLVNGAITPHFDVDQQKVRFRIVNGSNARVYNLSLSDQSSFYQIASDGGFLEQAVEMNSLSLSPGERAEIIIDFSTYDKGEELLLMNDDLLMMRFNIENEIEDSTIIPKQLNTLSEIDLSLVSGYKEVELDAMGMMVSIDGQRYDMARIDDQVKKDAYEIWTVSINSSMMSTAGHPFHIHSTQFRILSINNESPPKNLQGLKDTVYIKNGDRVELLVQFKHRGIFMYHCHILEHEEAGMMAQIEVY